MAGLPKKKQTVDSLKTIISDNNIAVVVNHTGLTVAEITDLRRQLRKESAELHVVKNTLMRRAVNGSELEAMVEHFKGPTAIALGKEDPIAPLKVLKEFLKKKKENEIRGGFLDGKALSSQEVAQLADLPSIEELRGKLVMCIASPLNGLVSALNTPGRNLANVLDQYGQTKNTGEASA
ncbi:MAG: 50S ribosomal protein L10 [Vampirovibrio sp.]|nr:50S ribosomal protein L10 [Vampirovibrio sp.]